MVLKIVPVLNIQEKIHLFLLALIITVNPKQVASSFSYDTYYDLSDPLWDGSGCSSGNTCCSNINLPWFQYQLSEMTQDDIEVRICRDEEFSNEGVLIDIIELYVQ